VNLWKQKQNHIENIFSARIIIMNTNAQNAVCINVLVSHFHLIQAVSIHSVRFNMTTIAVLQPLQQSTAFAKMTTIARS
jgi:hypothetical protein